MTTRFIGMLVLIGALIALAPRVAAADRDEEAIRAVIEQRRVAWNAGDTDAYARLLTPDADLMSATHRSAYGREAIIQLYLE